MPENINGLKQLEKRVGTLQILVHLQEHKKATITNLINDAHLVQRTTYGALAILREQGLVFREESLGFPVCKYYFLTEKGQRVAKGLCSIGTVLDTDS